MTVLLCGIPSEPSISMVLDQLSQLGTDVMVFNQRQWSAASIEVTVHGTNVDGWLRIGNDAHRLEEFDAAYTRLMDDQQLPEIMTLPPNSRERLRCRRLHEILSAWLEIAPGRVVNRSDAQGSNFSKPYQGQLIRSQGFSIPDTLITNDPSLAREFWKHHRNVVYKSMSGIRSIVQIFSPEDEARLGQIRWCPIQFQAYVPGLDVRVHVVGSNTFATAIHTTAADYRYANRSATDVELKEISIDDKLAGRCVRMSADLGLPLSGVDLKITPSGEVFCFEVNPSPAFSYYESITGQPIARALARFLAARESSP